MCMPIINGLLGRFPDIGRGLEVRFPISQINNIINPFCVFPDRCDLSEFRGPHPHCPVRYSFRFLIHCTIFFHSILEVLDKPVELLQALFDFLSISAPYTHPDVVLESVGNARLN